MFLSKSALVLPIPNNAWVDIEGRSNRLRDSQEVDVDGLELGRFKDGCVCGTGTSQRGRGGRGTTGYGKIRRINTGRAPAHLGARRPISWFATATINITYKDSAGRGARGKAHYLVTSNSIGNARKATRCARSPEN